MWSKILCPSDGLPSACVTTWRGQMILSILHDMWSKVLFTGGGMLRACVATCRGKMNF